MSHTSMNATANVMLSRARQKGSQTREAAENDSKTISESRLIAVFSRIHDHPDRSFVLNGGRDRTRTCDLLRAKQSFLPNSLIT